ncbi:MAG: 2-aminoethylphosphonate--pyruvate aminotransferase, partial [Bacteroidetes bacterium]
EPTDKNYNFEQMHDYLYAKGFTIYPGKGAKKATFRLSVLGDLYAQDIKNFLVVLADYLKEKQISNF